MARPSPTPQYTRCATCGHFVVYATTPDGRRVALDTGLRAYHLILKADNMHYRAEPSSSYPVHACAGKEP